jgi:exodeoxyribonuclease VII large subunit
LASPFGFVDAQAEQLGLLNRRIREIADFRLERAKHEIEQLSLRAHSLSPQLTLSRGYAVVTDEKGKVLTKAKSGQAIVVRTESQEIQSTVNQVKEL